jgi:hypothetical protein
MRAGTNLPGRLQPWRDEFWQALQGWAASVGLGTAA